ncbi:hypothetical protein ONV78_16180 [Hahella sp. CR1]|nr:hypothetical protein [Hahella sp. CR1]MDG9669281.1 hypothetical protein [Hahella sp. CR1]
MSVKEEILKALTIECHSSSGDEDSIDAFDESVLVELQVVKI